MAVPNAASSASTTTKYSQNQPISCVFQKNSVTLYSDECLYSMKFVRIIEGFDHLWAVKAQDKEADELTILFRNWTNGEYLLDFFM